MAALLLSIDRTSSGRPIAALFRFWSPMADAREPSVTSQVTEENIRTVARLEQAAMHHRTLGERVSDRLVRLMGSIGFVLLHIVGLAVWFAINLRLVPGVRPFDPFPFGILTLIVSTEGVLLALFILVSQNSMNRQADQRAHLDLQISLLAEQETTKILQMLHALSEHAGLVDESSREEVERLAQGTDIAVLAEELDRTLPRR
jgi:uncharacterized membrane protein